MTQRIGDDEALEILPLALLQDCILNCSHEPTFDFSSSRRNLPQPRLLRPANQPSYRAETGAQREVSRLPRVGQVDPAHRLH